MNLRFWGVRGSIPTPQADRLRYGGNTSCLEIGGLDSREVFLIDGGSGIRVLGEALAQRRVERVHILLTHFHWDHIQGLPYFPPLFRAETEIVFYADRSAREARRLLETQMADPFFPLPFEALPSRAEFHPVVCGQPFQAGPLTVEAFPLHHPQGAVGYRVEAQGSVLVHASDHEHGNPETDAGLVRAARGADLLVMDAQYTPEEYAGKVGWGHSSYAQATEAARAAGVRRLALFHHDPAHNDAFLDGMLAEAKRLFPGAEMAREGETLEIG
ncbi:MAG: MBL fold metallo-hydrolase [Acidobacteriaceae bacterium]